ncbi:hypothetical protein L484_016195 [Morus notabilis]|uniref:Uncharacterized protein n=1 Tax=Morus notabilis TaxID=981085 RepID=W9S4X3_9ROSA|nr:hypothetical protein L484_016195 [Morus notabilis]
MARKISLTSLTNTRSHCLTPEDIEIFKFNPTKDIAVSGDLIKHFFDYVKLRPNQCNSNTFRILSGVCALNAIFVPAFVPSMLFFLTSN